MITFIKTAIITIVISIISGLLLERCKSLGPKILCDIGKARILDLGNKKVYAYIITVSNLSNKTLHELTLNIHGTNSAIKFNDAKITKGLKFDSSAEEDFLDIFIPYLSKGDEFSITVYLENGNKPVIAMRSPENFKQMDSKKQAGFLSSLLNKSKNIKSTSSKDIKTDRTIYNEESDYTIVMNRVSGAEKINGVERNNNKNKKISKNKKIMIAFGSIVVLIISGVLVKFNFKEATANRQSTPVKADVHKSSNDSKESEDKTTKNVDNKKSTGGTAKNVDSNTPTGETNKGTDNKASTGEINKSTDIKPATGDVTKSTDTKSTTEDKTKSTDAKTSTGDTTKNSNTNISTGGESKGTDTKPATGDTTKGTDTKSPTIGTTENKNN